MYILRLENLEIHVNSINKLVCTNYYVNFKIQVKIQK